MTELIAEYRCEMLVGICVFFLTYVVILLLRNVKSYPPGPMGLPFIGYLPFLSEDVHLDFIQLGKKYGDVFSIRLGFQNVVVLHGGEAIRESLLKSEFLGRPPYGTLQFINPLTAFFGDNMAIWKEQRRFLVKTLRNLGVRKTKFEDEVMVEIDSFLEVLKSHKGKPMDMKRSLQASISNNICALIFGKRYDHDDPRRIFLDKNLDKAMNSFNGQLIFVIPLDTTYSIFP